MGLSLRGHTHILHLHPTLDLPFVLSMGLSILKETPTSDLDCSSFLDARLIHIPHRPGLRTTDVDLVEFTQKIRKERKG